MHIEDIREYCLAKPFTTESMPFGDDTLVMKAADKMFLLANLEGPLRISIKARPEDVLECLEKYPEVIPAYHLNKQHWMAVEMDHISEISLVKTWIDNSYNLIINSLPKKKRLELKLPR